MNKVIDIKDYKLKKEKEEKVKIEIKEEERIIQKFINHADSLKW